MRYDFTWDRQKAAGNRRKHGVTFEEAATVFRDTRMLAIYDDEHSGAEDRWLTLGFSALGRLLVVCHTFEEDTEDSATVRMFSSRKATQRERQQYEG